MTLYYRPDTLSAALELLNDSRQKALPLYYSPRAKNLKDWQADALVELTELGLNEIHLVDDELRLGSMVPLEEIAENETCRALWDGVLSKAVSYSATKAMRALATLGGVLTEPANPPEILLVLMALGAEVILIGGNEKVQKMDVSAFISSREGLPQGCLIQEVVLPVSSRPRCVLERIARTEKDTAIVALAAAWDSPNAQARIAVSGVKELPYSLSGAEDVLRREGGLTAEAVAKAAEAAASESVTVEDFRGSAEYRQAMVPVLVRRALNELNPSVNA